MSENGNQEFSGYVCKSCGAESPVGIGYYAANGPADAPHPAAGCPGPHVESEK